MKRTWLLVLLALTQAAPAFALVRHVPAQYATIHAAMTAAVSGDVVEVAEGVFSDVTHPCSPTDTTKTVVIMKSGVTLRGQGRNATIIDALQLGRGIYCSGVSNAMIEGLTVRHAFAATYGSGIYVFSGCASTLTIRSCEITANYDGGIIVRDSSSPTIQDCWMTNNAAKEGGGLAVDVNCAPAVTGCWITGNQAPSGAGVFVRGASTLTISNCIINGNFINLAAGSGGGVTVASATLNMSNCLVNQNTSSASGGGFAISESVVNLTGCQIVGNTTTSSYGPGGGIMADFNTDLTAVDCLIANNSVQGTDGGSDGGGVRAFFAAQLTLRSCTIAANRAQGGLGGGVSASWCTPTIEKCIVSHSTAGAGLFCDDQGSFTVSCTDVFGNAGGDALCGTNLGNNFSLNPLFCDLANRNYYLQSTSPCAPGQHPNGAGACGGTRIGTYGVTNCATVDVEIPDLTANLTARPNPFRTRTELGFSLPREAKATVRIYDPAGRELRTLVDRVLPAGPHRETWDGTDAAGRLVPSGVYFYQLSIDGRKETQRLVVAR